MCTDILGTNSYQLSSGRLGRVHRSCSRRSPFSWEICTAQCSGRKGWYLAPRSNHSSSIQAQAEQSKDRVWPLLHFWGLRLSAVSCSWRYAGSGRSWSPRTGSEGLRRLTGVKDSQPTWKWGLIRVTQSQYGKRSWHQKFQNVDLGFG